jgi:NADH:ubiquinone oxidoreductase subunit 6 (subunit J)
MVAQNIGFAIIAIIMIVGALRVVTTSNVCTQRCG